MERETLDAFDFSISKGSVEKVSFKEAHFGRCRVVAVVVVVVKGTEQPFLQMS